MSVSQSFAFGKMARKIWIPASVLLLLFFLAFSTQFQASYNRSTFTLSSLGFNSSSPIKEVSIPQNLSYPLGLAVDRKGDVWFAEGNTDSIVEFNAYNQTFRAFSIPIPSQFAFIWTPVFDSSGNLWFATANDSDIWRLNTTSGEFASFSTGNPKDQPYTLAYNPSRNQLWFTSLSSSQFGVFQLTNNGSATLLHVYRLPVTKTPVFGSVGAAAIALDDQGNVYVTESFIGEIAKFNQSSGISEHVWSLPEGGEPLGIAVDPITDLVWFTDHATSDFGYVNQTSNTITEISTSVFYYNGNPEVSLPYWIYISSLGMIWFNEHAGNRIARFDPIEMRLTEFAVPTPSSEPIKLTLDDQRGLVWFSEFSGNKIGMLEQNQSLSPQIVLSKSSLILSRASVSLQANISSENVLPLNVSTTASKTGVLSSNFTVRSSSLSNSQIEITLARGSSLSPGQYYITFCTTSDAPVRSCAIASINVEASDNVYFLISLGVAAVAITLAISIYFVRRWQVRVR